jgi:hypothetical protein
VIVVKKKCAFFIFQIGLLSACATPTFQESVPTVNVDWISESAAYITVSSREIDSSRYAELRGVELIKGIDMLRRDEILVISREQIFDYFSVAGRNLGDAKIYYLVRGSSNQGRGQHVAYYTDGALRIDYVQLGGCGEPINTAFLVAIDDPIQRVYGGCSGAM